MDYLALDLGSKSLGLARGAGQIAFSWKTLYFKENDYQQAKTLLIATLKEYRPQAIILGYPLNMDNSRGMRAQISEDFKLLLEGDEKFKDITVTLFDERRTTKSANAILISVDMSREKRKKVKDQLAAAIILQNYFDRLNKGGFNEKK